MVEVEALDLLESRVYPRRGDLREVEALDLLEFRVYPRRERERENLEGRLD